MLEYICIGHPWCLMSGSKLYYNFLLCSFSFPLFLKILSLMKRHCIPSSSYSFRQGSSISFNKLFSYSSSKLCSLASVYVSCLVYVIIDFLFFLSSVVLVATFSHGFHYIGSSSDHEALGMILFLQSCIHFTGTYLFELTLL